MVYGARRGGDEPMAAGVGFAPTSRASRARPLLEQPANRSAPASRTLRYSGQSRAEGRPQTRQKLGARRRNRTLVDSLQECGTATVLAGLRDQKTGVT